MTFTTWFMSWALLKNNSSAFLRTEDSVIEGIYSQLTKD